MKQETKQWIKQAEEELSAARDTFITKHYSVASFLCQQAVEKALKALLLETTGAFPKIHDLAVLGKKCNLPPSLLEKCDRLSQVYIETRYINVDGKLPYQKFNKENTTEFMAYTAEILQWLKKKISSS